MQSSRVHAAQRFEGGTTFRLFEEVAHFATCVVMLVEIRHVDHFAPGEALQY